MPRPTVLLTLAALSACAGVSGARSSRGDDLPERLASRAASLVGERGAFEVGGRRFNADCSGFVEAVFHAEGIPLRALMERVAPRERSAVVAVHLALERYGRTFGAGVRPRPGDLVFFHHTYDRDRNGRLDERLSHVGIVERVSGETVVFLHRGNGGVVRAVMTLARRDEMRAGDGRELNSPLRRKRADWAGAPVLAGQLFALFGRVEPDRIPTDL
ncbi:MAG TPA: NlpC/P60 family protein [Anaeromyxobacteraceae bacterium]|nr:NlpC/P60 family protein [Anaeromyxobacteraceae bacterium]